jgi:hypothetical protein
MKARTVVVALAFCFAGAAICCAQMSGIETSIMGTWKLNEAKSKFGNGAGKSTTVTYQADGDSVKVTVEGTDATGAATHSEWTGKFDGKEYPATGGAAGATRSYRKVNDHTLTFEEKESGRVTERGRIVVSADGKSRTVTISAINKEGVKVTSTAVYDKQ